MSSVMLSRSPNTPCFFIGSDQPVARDPELLVQRLEERNISTAFLTPAYIRYRLTTDRIAQTEQALENNRSARLNTDSRPTACFYNLTWWLSSFHPDMARFLNAWAGRAPVWLFV